MAEPAIDYDARSLAQSALSEAQKSAIRSEAAITAIRDHEDRCLEATKRMSDEIALQRQQSQVNHEAIDRSISRFHDNLESTCTDLYTKISGLTAQDATIKEASAAKEAGFYKMLAIGAIGLVVTLIGVVYGTVGVPG